MTNEEAIKWFRESPFWHKDHVPFNMAIQALEQEPIITSTEDNAEMIYPQVEGITPTVALPDVDKDFQIGDEVRIIGSDPIYDDCDVGWVIRNASERVKTMYVMRNDGSADEENKAEWYKTGRHNAMLAEVIKQLPHVKPQEPTGHWIIMGDRYIKCSECGHITKTESPDIYNFCMVCGANMSENPTSSKPEISSYYGLKSYVREREDKE